MKLDIIHKLINVIKFTFSYSNYCTTELQCCNSALKAWLCCSNIKEEPLTGQTDNLWSKRPLNDTKAYVLHSQQFYTEGRIILRWMWEYELDRGGSG
jgi:hypothetical protein